MASTDVTAPSQKKRKGQLLSDEDIVVRVNQKSREAVGWYDSKISKERERALQYYNGELPKRQDVGSSSFVSTDVYDGVETAKSQLLETFAAGDEIVRVDPHQDMSVADCEAATAWARHVLFQQNDGFNLFQSVIHDALMARIGPVKVWWDESYETNEESFDGLGLDQVQALAVQDDVDDLEAELDPQTGAFSGTLIRRKDCSQIRILAIPPEEFLVAPRAVTLKRADYLGHRTLKTKAELKDMGLDPKKVDEVHYDDYRGLDLSPEVLARNHPVETYMALNNPIQPELEQVMLYESYVKMVVDKKKGARLYKVLHASDILFEYEEVAEHPFECYVPLPTPHIVFGNNFAMKLVPTQNARTVLIRSILDHTVMTTNPRWQVVQGGLLNPREMADNRKGGLVNVRREGAVSALEVPNMNPFVFQVLQQLEQSAEKTTGISSLSQGLDKNAISTQNSRGMVQDLVSLSTQRQKIAARNFAYGFLLPLIMRIIKLTILHQTKTQIIEVAGQPIKIDASKWSQGITATVSFHLGYGERDDQANARLELYKGLASDPALQTMFTPVNRYNLIVDTAKLKGVYSISRYITPPGQVQPPQPDPIKQQEIAIKKQQADAAMITAQANATKNERLAAFEVQKLTNENAKMHMEAMAKDRENDRLDIETVSRVNIAEREMVLAESTPVSKEQVNISPRI